MPDQAPRRARDVERELVAGMQKLGAGPRRLWEELANRVPEADGFVVMSMAELAQALGAPESSLRRWRDHLVGRGMIAVDWALGPNGGRSRRDSSAFIRMLPVGSWCGLPGSNRKRPHGPPLSIVGEADPQRTMNLDFGEQTALRVAPEVAPEVAPPSHRASRASDAKPGAEAAAGNPQNNSPRASGYGDLRVQEVQVQESASTTSNRLKESTVRLQKDLDDAKYDVEKIGEEFPGLDKKLWAARPIPERVLQGILDVVPLRGTTWIWVAHRLVELVAFGDPDHGRLLDPRVVQGLVRKFLARKRQTELDPISDVGRFFHAMAEEAVVRVGFTWRRRETDRKPKPR